MKIRMTTAEIEIINLNPVNGIDVELPDELYDRFVRVWKQVDAIHDEVHEAISPQIDTALEALEQWHTKHGLTMIKGGKD